MACTLSLINQLASVTHHPSGECACDSDNACLKPFKYFHGHWVIGVGGEMRLHLANIKAATTRPQLSKTRMIRSISASTQIPNISTTQASCMRNQSSEAVARVMEISNRRLSNQGKAASPERNGITLTEALCQSTTCKAGPKRILGNSLNSRQTRHPRSAYVRNKPKTAVMTTVKGRAKKSCARLAGNSCVNHQTKKTQLVVRASKILKSRTARFYEISAIDHSHSHFFIESVH
jgi:hypothetical protein